MYIAEFISEKISSTAHLKCVLDHIRQHDNFRILFEGLVCILQGIPIQLDRQLDNFRILFEGLVCILQGIPILLDRQLDNFRIRATIYTLYCTPSRPAHPAHQHTQHTRTHSPAHPAHQEPEAGVMQKGRTAKCVF